MFNIILQSTSRFFVSLFPSSFPIEILWNAH
jgi:hypothetical protein